MKDYKIKKGCTISVGPLIAIAAGLYVGYKQAKGLPMDNPYLILATPPILAAGIGPFISKQANRMSKWAMQKVMEGYHEGTLTYKDKNIMEYPLEKRLEIGEKLEQDFGTLEENIKQQEPLKQAAKSAGLAGLCLAAGYGLGYTLGSTF